MTRLETWSGDNLQLEFQENQNAGIKDFFILREIGLQSILQKEFFSEGHCFILSAIVRFFTS